MKNALKKNNAAWPFTRLTTFWNPLQQCIVTLYQCIGTWKHCGNNALLPHGMGQIWHNALFVTRVATVHCYWQTVHSMCNIVSSAMHCHCTVDSAVNNSLHFQFIAKRPFFSVIQKCLLKNYLFSFCLGDGSKFICLFCFICFLFPPFAATSLLRFLLACSRPGIFFSALPLGCLFGSPNCGAPKLKLSFSLLSVF